MKILIIDDEPLDLFIAKTVLQGEFEVEGFTTLKDCLIWAGENDFDAVLIDYYLDTDLHATDVLEALRKLKSGAIKNAFVLSSFVDSAQLNKLKESGFEGVINKPISLAVIRAKLGVVH